MSVYMRHIRLAVALLLALTPCFGNAREIESARPVAAYYTFECGSSSMTDTYLSPLTFSGWHLGIGYERRQAMKFNPERWIFHVNGRLSADRGVSSAANRVMWGGNLDLGAGMAHRWELPFRGFAVSVGGELDADLGVLYINRGGNNPASAKGTVTISATASASWRTSIGRLPVTLSYSPRLPLAGVFFAPDYDELYYEIYLGNRHGLVHFASPFNRFAMTNYVTADLSAGSTIIRIGYRSTLLSSSVSHVTTNWHTNQFVIGIGGEWLSASAVKRISPDARIISATY